MYANFQHAYCGKDNEPLLDRGDSIDLTPLIVIDCCKQNDTPKLLHPKNAPVEYRIEMEARVAFSASTAALCLIIHARIIEYNPVSNELHFDLF